MTLRVSVLGAPLVERDGLAVAFDTRKAVALVAYLAVTGGLHRREALAGLCWPELDRERAGGALRRTLSALRSAAGPEVLVAEQSSVALADDVEVDLRKARALQASCADHGHQRTDVCEACIEPLTAVAELHRGRFLEGFGLRDSDAFDDWQFFTGEELRRELAGVLERLTQVSSATGDLDGAIAVARRWLALDPLHEPAHRTLIRLFAEHGQHAAAVRQYRECVRILDTELGVVPLDATSALYRDVLERRVAPAQQPAGAPPAPPPRHSTRAGLVGRDRERQALLEIVRRGGPDGAFAVVEGEGGIGKSRLVSDVLAEAAGTGHHALVAQAFSGESGLAYGVVVQALREGLAASGLQVLEGLDALVRAEVARLLPEVAADAGAPVTPLDGPGGQWRLMDALGNALVALVAGTRRGVLVFEDLHWADQASVDVVIHLARRLRGRDVTLIGTWRTQAVGRRHRLRTLLGDSRREGTGVAVTLDRLDLDAVVALLQGAGLPAEQAGRLFEATEGIPLLLVEYLAALADDPRALDGPLPGGARDLLLGRLHAVGGTAAQMLASAAVIGRSFDFDIARDASGRGDEETAAALEELTTAGLVVERAGAYDFTHAQLRSLAYAETGLARRRLLHRRVASALAERGRRRRSDGSSAGVIAGHLQLAGDESAAAEYAALAGDHAAALLADAEAVAHYRQALALGAGTPARLHEALGDLHTLAGRYGEALTAYEAAAALDPAREGALEHKLGGVQHRQGQWGLAESHFAAALAAADVVAGAALRARVLADRSRTADCRGRGEQADVWARQALAAAELAEDLPALAQVHNLLGLLLRDDGGSAREHLERSLALAQKAQDASAEVAAANNLALAEARVGNLPRALELAELALARCAATRDRHREAAVRNNLADLSRQAGLDDQAMEHLKRAVAVFAEIGDPGVLAPEIWKLVAW